LLVARPGQSFESLFAHAMWLKTWLGDRAGLAVRRLLHADEDDLIDALLRVHELTGLPLVATGDVLMHRRSRKPLQDVLSATRLGRPLAECGWGLQPNAEQHLRSRGRLARLFEPEWLQASVAWAARCSFSLAQLRYEYPQEIVPPGLTPSAHLRALTEAGARRRYPSERYPAGPPPKVRQLIEHELALIAQLQYEPYFLTVADIVAWARAQGILCQGRGSAANSAVCNCLHITEVDPERMSVLFERFISAERNEPPDIDVDFEHERREEVIQHIYRKYGRHRAALTGVITRYRPRSALRDVGRALGLDIQRIEAVTRMVQGHSARALDPERLREQGFDAESPLCRLWLELAEQLLDFPRHLSQHPGGFVIAKDQIAQLVPVENAAMDGRSVIQWDKDDLDALGLLKVDVLALGMLSAISKALALIALKTGRPFAMQDVPPECPATYAMLGQADSVGVFQIESRAQMSMLARLKPQCFYDLVIQVAIVRPGPIQGGMVHPYLRRRRGEEPVSYPSEEVREALSRTLGVPIFQEQVMQLAVLAADFTPGEADSLRRAMAAWKRKGGLGPFHERLVGRMVAKGYTPEFAESIFLQIQGFGEYGFPESHAASFALLVYVSAWIKRHHPDVFLAALLNSQPMGFYAPAQLVRDARAHGVEVLPVDVLHSEVPSTLEAPLDRAARPQVATPTAPDAPLHAAMQTATHAVRLGLHQIRGLAAEATHRVAAVGRAWRERAPRPAREHPPEPWQEHRPPKGAVHSLAAQQASEAGVDGVEMSVEALARAAALEAADLRHLADAGALRSLAGHRHQAAWAVAGVDTRVPALLRPSRWVEPEAELDAPDEASNTLADYRRLGLTLGTHPLALLRSRLAAFQVQPAVVLKGYPNGRVARASGLVTHRQRPGTAKGVVFVTLEDDTGAVNVIVWPQVAERHRTELLGARLLTVFGQWQSADGVMHLVAKRLIDHSEMVAGLLQRSRDFR
jgi:error-prone DNA polymerase